MPINQLTLILKILMKTS